MQKLRKLASNIFVKISLLLLVVSFAFFGVSDFLLNGSNAWIAKVGGKTISYNKFTKILQKDRESILQANPNNEQALQYVSSQQFKSDILGRLINDILIGKLRKDFGITASKDLILKQVAKNPQFYKDGKFDHQYFKSFLAQNGLDEEKYIKAMSDEAVGSMIISSISYATPINAPLASDLASFKEEKRIADVIVISDKNLVGNFEPSAGEINKAFEDNRVGLISQEMRKVSFLKFSISDLKNDHKATKEETLSEYEKNKDNYKTAEIRSFLHILFDKEDSAKKFLEEFQGTVKQGKSSPEDIFTNLAKKNLNKEKKSISLQNVKNTDLIPDLSSRVFKLPLNESSEVLKSPLGFHIFFATQLNSSVARPFSEVKNEIEQKIQKEKRDRFASTKITEIQDFLLTSNSLSETAKKFGLSKNLFSEKIDQLGNASVGKQSSVIAELDSFAKNAFLSNEGNVSKLYNSKSGTFYAIKVDEVQKSRSLTFEEAKPQLVRAFVEKKRMEKLRDFAKKIEDETRANPSLAQSIAKKYSAKFEAKKEFPRVSYLEFQGRKIPYQDKFSSALFDAKLQKSTPIIQASNNEFALGVVREIKKTDANTDQINQSKIEAGRSARNEVLQEFNVFLQKKYPVEVNKKLMSDEKNSAEYTKPN
jgi:peptidyl-prolyl cis-trans isomerase D